MGKLGREIISLLNFSSVCMGLGEVCVNLVYARGSQCVGYVSVGEKGVRVGRWFGKFYNRPAT